MHTSYQMGKITHLPPFFHPLFPQHVTWPYFCPPPPPGAKQEKIHPCLYPDKRSCIKQFCFMNIFNAYLIETICGIKEKQHHLLRKEFKLFNGLTTYYWLFNKNPPICHILAFTPLKESLLSYNELSQKTRFQSVPIAALCLYNIQCENLVFKNSLCI